MRFLIYQRKKEVEESELMSSTSRMTVVMRVAAERHNVESRQAMIRAKAHQVGAAAGRPWPRVAGCSDVRSAHRFNSGRSYWRPSQTLLSAFQCAFGRARCAPMTLPPRGTTTRLHFIGQAISDQTETAERHFTQLLRINPHSVTALRSYSQFLLEVVNNAEKVRSSPACSPRLARCDAAP